MPSHARILGAEALGTAILILTGPGTALLLDDRGDETLAIAVGFGLGFAIATILVGPRSGAQINPAVTLALLVAHRIDGKVAAVSWIGQLIGAATGGAGVVAVAASRPGFERAALSSNGWGDLSPGGFDWPGVALLDVVTTAVVVVVVLTLISDRRSWPVRALVMGITMAGVAVITAPVSMVGANPARSIATALYASTDSQAMGMIWLFLLTSIPATVLGVVLWLMIADERLENTGLFLPPVAQARDLADHVVERAVDAVDDVVDHAGRVDENR